MKIKKLEILGFKSFIDKAILSFPRGITAIVGPNGSGKSNLVDAVKWALGEQSSKSLRGKSMEDVIFNGSREKKPLGMAEVTITFTNVDGNVPHNFPRFGEVSVRRRIYRSGMSEYYLNKTPCRLKDINDIFIGTGVGTKAYSIIAQGQIGDIITARPLDRRYLIEEAAGITKYKSKKIEALRKIDYTQQNLLRIGDIIRELKRQLETLSQQAERAEEFKKLRADLKHFELIDASRRYLTLTQKLDKEDVLYKSDNEKETAISCELSAVEERIESLKNSSIEKEEYFSEILKKSFTNEARIKALEESIKQTRDRIESTKNRNDIFLADIEELSQFITESKNKVEKLSLQMNSSIEEADLYETNLKNIEAELDKVQETLTRLTGDQEALRVDELSNASNIARLKNAMSSSEKWIHNSKEEIEKKSQELLALREESEKIEGLIEEARSEIEKAKVEEEKIQIARKKAEDELKALKEKEFQAQRAIEEEKYEETRITLRLKSLEEMEKNFEGTSEGTKAVMCGDRQGVLGILADFLKSDKKYEKALEVYLGEALSSVVVKNIDNVKNHIRKLKESGAGRASFIPIDALKESEDSEVLNSEGVIGRFKDYINIKGENKEAISSFFGDAHLVSDIDSALRIWVDKSPDFPLVTLQGEVLLPNGLIFGGDSEDRGKSILANRRERDSLNQKLKEIRGSLNIKGQEFEGIKNKISSVESRLKDESDLLTSLKIKGIETEKELNSIMKDKERVAKAKSSISGEIEWHTSETERLKSELEETANLLTEAEEREGELEERSRVLKLALEESQGDMRRLKEHQTELKLSLGKARDNVEHIRQTSEEYTTQIERAERDIEKKRAAVSQGEEETSSLEEKVFASESELSERKDSEGKIADELKDARSRLDNVEKIENELESERKDIMMKLSSIREDLQQKKDKIKEFLWERENLTALIKERYQVDLADKYIKLSSHEIEGGELSQRIDRLKRRIEKFGDVNLMALSEFKTLGERHEFLCGQESDLVQSLDSLKKTIQKIDKRSRERFMVTFDEVNEKFQEVFSRLVPGGRANLSLTEDQDPLESGVDIMAQPPGKRLLNINLLSGGEKALAAIALIFSIFMVKPSPFCLLDEVDAPLDDLNIERFIELLKDISMKSQVILITHNKKTMELADTLFGITMQDSGVSKMVSIKLTEEKEAQSNV